MNNTLVISPKCASKSAKELAKKLQADYSNPYMNGIYFNKYKTVVNFGISELILHHNVINKGSSVKTAVNKLLTFKLLKDNIRMVPFTTTKKKALEWLSKGKTVVIRELTNSTKSKGCSFTNKKSDVIEKPAKFYTQYINHVKELRVNSYKGKILNTLNKKEVNNFFEFEEDSFKSQQLTDMIKEIYNITNLDFFGADVLVSKRGTCYLLEINSAPSLLHTEKTMSKFINAIKKDIK